MMKPTSKKIGQADQKGRGQHGPRGVFDAELFEQPVGEGAAAAGVFQEAADHGAQAEHHGDESEGVAEARLDGFQHFVRRHAGGQAHRHRGN